MGLRDLVSSVSGDAKGLLDLLGDKMAKWLDDYKRATTQLEAIGFKVDKMNVGMGVLPEVHATLIGAIDSIKPDQLKAMMEEKKEDALLVAMLKALVLAKKVADHVETKLESVTLNVKLGLPPSVDIELS